MTHQIDRYIYPILERLKLAIEPLNIPDSLDGLIAQHFDTHGRLQRAIGWCQSALPDEWIGRFGDTLSQAPQLATLGALLATQTPDARQIDENAADAFHQGLGGLQKRGDDFSSPTSWILQPSNVLGIGLGIRAIGDTQSERWFVDLIKKGNLRKSVPLLPKLMYGYVLHLFGVTQPAINVLSLIDDIHTCSLPELGFAIWITRHDIGNWSSGNKIDWLQDAQASFLERMLTEEPYETEDYKAALLWEVATGYLLNIPSPVDSSNRVSLMLQNFPAALERWKKEWKIENEADLQSLVFLILRTYFDDLRYEENLPKLGRSGHRYDIGIPHLKLLVELKYTRKNSDFQKFVTEIGEDVTQIHAQTMFTGFIVFIFDPTCSTENYAWTKQTMLQFAPVVKDVVIVCAPAVCR